MLLLKSKTPEERKRNLTPIHPVSYRLLALVEEHPNGQRYGFRHGSDSKFMMPVLHPSIYRHSHHISVPLLGLLHNSRPLVHTRTQKLPYWKMPAPVWNGNSAPNVTYRAAGRIKTGTGRFLSYSTNVC